MKKGKFNLLVAGVVLAMAFIFSCSSGDDVGGGGGDPQSYSYCIYIEAQTCFAGPYKECPGEGIPSNSCPYVDIEPSSSSAEPSSSSVSVSNSSSVPSSSSLGGDNTCSADFRTVTIGTQTWMAENLNCNVEGSKCYDNDPDCCTKYGRRYDWATAMALPSNCNSRSCSNQIGTKHRGICPSGWHIPSYEDWDALVKFVGGSGTAGAKLKAKSGWDNSGNGTDDYEFSALPGGYGVSGGGFGGVGMGLWWSTALSHDDVINAYCQYMSRSNGNVNLCLENKSTLYSVRCVQD
jgi:uncharacterized protein (TIGR02145 family)